MPHTSRPTHPSMGGFGLRVLAGSGESTEFFVSFDRAAKAFAQLVDPETVWGGPRSRVRLASSCWPELFWCDAGTCLTVVVASQTRLWHEASPGKCAHESIIESRQERHFEVTNPFGKRLNLWASLARGRVLLALEGRSRRGGRSRRFRAVYCGYGPVPGIRKWRGGSGYMRCIHTTAELRLNALVLKEEGETPPRAARTAHSLPTSWDDFVRERKNGWKAQHKGAKSWDRLKVLSLAEKAEKAEKAANWH